MEYRTIQPLQYYRHILECQNVRPDGRRKNQVRKISLNVSSISTADGSAIVKFGNTTVICGIKGELCSPKLETPDEGFIIPNMDLPPLCCSQFRPGLPSDQAQIGTQFLTELLDSCQCINTKKLCIKPGQLVWVLYCDFLCLDFDGNLFDASTLALIAALQNTVLPKISIGEDGNITASLHEKQILTTECEPVSLSFVIFDQEEILVDPTAEEEHLATGNLTIISDTEDSICCLYKPGGRSLNPNVIKDCMQQVMKHRSIISQLLQKLNKK